MCCHEVFMLSPHSTMLYGLKKFTESIPFSSVLENIKDGVVYHTSTRNYAFGNGEKDYFIHQEPTVLFNCGGPIEFKTAQGLSEKIITEGNVKGRLRCSFCDTEFLVPFTKQEFSEILWQMLLKQMIPDLPTANVIDARIFGWGIISVFKIVIKGVARDYDQIKRIIGFDLLPLENNLDTKEKANGLDAWMRYLFVEERERNMKSMKEALRRLMGPKSIHSKMPGFE